ncbi:MAG: hypothetical protein ACTSYU_11600 [Promethearchaeota archaeon]
MILQVWFEVTTDEMQTFIIELVISLIALGTVIGLLVIKKKYPKLTKKGFPILMLGYFVYALHFLLDLMDTLAMKELNGEKTTIYLIFDYLDAFFSLIGLFIIGLGFFYIARFGMSIWEAPSK